jgi:hypothetical protein
MSSVIQHYLNPLHVYCRLRNLGLGKKQAAFICRIYEQIIFRIFILKVQAG